MGWAPFFGVGGTGGGSSTLLGLTDVFEADYTGHNGNVLVVNPGETGMIFGTAGGKFVDGTDPLDAVYTGGNVGIGTITPQSGLHTVGQSGTDEGFRIDIDNNSDVNNPAQIRLNRSEGDPSSKDIVQGGSLLGSLLFRGYGGSSDVDGAEIEAIVFGNPGVSDMPTTLNFKVSADGTANPVTAMTIVPTGRVGVGAVTPQGNLHVRSGNTGSTPQFSADELIIEGSGDTGITIIGGEATHSNIFFGGNTSSFQSAVRWQPSGLLMKVGTTVANGELILMSGGGAERIRVLSAGDIRLNNYLNTRDDTATDTQVNKLYTNSSGDIRSSPTSISELNPNQLTFTSNNADLTGGNLDRAVVGAVANDKLTIPTSAAVGTYGYVYNATAVSLDIAKDAADSFEGSPSLTLAADEFAIWMFVSANTILLMR